MRPSKKWRADVGTEARPYRDGRTTQIPIASELSVGAAANAAIACRWASVSSWLISLGCSPTRLVVLGKPR